MMGAQGVKCCGAGGGGVALVVPCTLYVLNLCVCV